MSQHSLWSVMLKWLLGQLCWMMSGSLLTSSVQVRLESEVTGAVFTHALTFQLSLKTKRVVQVKGPSPVFDLTCNYCLGRGHWKWDCPVLKTKNAVARFRSSPVKPTALAAPVPVSTCLVIPTETPTINLCMCGRSGGDVRTVNFWRLCVAYWQR